MESKSEQIQRNKKIHDRISARYDQIHGEIFNDSEQARIRETLRYLLKYFPGGPSSLRALDFGAGTGNLSRHMVSVGWPVLAVDVSEQSLNLLKRSLPCETLVLQDGSLQGIPTNGFDFVATYSVLHHIPDYLAAIRELGRVCASGGIIYIDHEPTPMYWERREEFKAIYRRISKPNITKYLYPRNYLGKARRMFDKRYSNEGDIHVWPDDHVEWPLIDETLIELGFEKVFEQDFFLNKSIYKASATQTVSHQLQDTRCVAYQKKY